jgi:hypothetical protein
MGGAGGVLLGKFSNIDGPKSPPSSTHEITAAIADPSLKAAR